MTCLWALVPIKELARAKTRLAEVLDAEARRDLALAMARDTVAALTACRSIDRVIVVSDIPYLSDTLGDAGTVAQFAAAAGGLNEDLDLAATWAAAQGAHRVLVVHADLPLLTPAVIDQFVAGTELATMRAAPCRHGSGTNLLLAPLPLPLPLVYGRDSLARFRAAAAQLNIPFELYRDPTLAADIDDAGDFRKLCQQLERDHRWQSATAAMLRRTINRPTASHA